MFKLRFTNFTSNYLFSSKTLYSLLLILILTSLLTSFIGTQLSFSIMKVLVSISVALLVAIIFIDFFIRYRYSISYVKLEHFTYSIMTVLLTSLLFFGLIADVTREATKANATDVSSFFFWELLFTHLLFVTFFVLLFSLLYIFGFWIIQVMKTVSQQGINFDLTSINQIEVDIIVNKIYKLIVPTTVFFHFVTAMVFYIQFQPYILSQYLPFENFKGSINEMIIVNSFDMYSKLLLITLFKPFLNIFKSIFYRENGNDTNND